MKLFFTALLTGLTLTHVHAKSADEIVLKSAYILKITSFIEFKNKNTENLEICFIGADEHFEKFESTFHGQKLNGKSFSVTKVNDLSKRFCLIYFIEQNAIKWKQADDNFIIAEEDGALEKGAIINFVMIKNSIKFEINNQKSEQLGHQINSRLLNLAIKVVK